MVDYIYWHSGFLKLIPITGLQHYLLLLLRRGERDRRGDLERLRERDRDLLLYGERELLPIKRHIILCSK